MWTISKINDLSNSPLKGRFRHKDFKPESHYAVDMGRVSTKRNKDKGNSDKAQLEHTHEYAEVHGLDILKTWDVAEAASDHESRRHFLDMICFIEDSQRTDTPIKHVIFSHQSRSNRNKKSARALEELLDLGVTIHFARESRKLTCKSDLGEWLQWHIHNVKNQEYIEELKRNIWDGTLKRLELGLFPGKAPYGYKNFRPSENETSYFVLFEERSEYMREAFQTVSYGQCSLDDLVKKLNSKYPQLTNRPNRKRMLELLRNPFYYGDFIYMKKQFRGNPDLHPRLIDYDLWKKVQTVLDKRLRGSTKERQLPYLGIMTCGGFILDAEGKETNQACGRAVTAEEKRKPLANGSTSYHYYYRCSRNGVSCSQKNKTFVQRFGQKRIGYTEAEIELLFEQVFKPLNFTEEVCNWMQNVLVKEHHEKSQAHYQQLSALQGRHKMLERYIDQAYEDKVRGEITESMWREKHGRWMAEKSQVKSEIDAIDEQKDDYIQKGVSLIELSQRCESIYKNANVDVKRKMVLLLSSNHVLRNGNIEFDWEKPFDLLAKSHPKEKWWR